MIYYGYSIIIIIISNTNIVILTVILPTQTYSKWSSH